MERGGLEVTTLCVIWLKEGRKHYFWGEVFSDPHEVFLRERERERMGIHAMVSSHCWNNGEAWSMNDSMPMNTVCINTCTCN